MERHVGQDRGKEAQSFHAPFRAGYPPKSPHAHQEVPWTSVFWIFTEASFHKHDWLSHLPLVLEFNLQPSLFTGQGVGLKAPTPLILWFLPPSKDLPPPLPWNPIPSLGVVQKSLTNHKQHFYCSYHIVNSKGLRNSVSKTGQRSNMYFLIINHNKTDTVPTICPLHMEITKFCRNTQAFWKTREKSSKTFQRATPEETRDSQYLTGGVSSCSCLLLPFDWLVGDPKRHLCCLCPGNHQPSCE